MIEMFKHTREFTNPNGHRYAVLELTRDCNYARVCEAYCKTPSLYNPLQEQTLVDTKKYVDLLTKEKFAIVSLLGGELLRDNPQSTSREGLTPYQHALQTVQYIKEVGMTVGIVTNGSVVKDYMIDGLAQAGLDSLTFSFHIHTNKVLDKLLNLATITGEAGIIPVINMLFTNKTGPKIPAVAAYTIQNGIPFACGLVQEMGTKDGLSQKNEESLLPSPEEQERTFRALRLLNKFGMVRTSSGYMRGNNPVNRNSWTCDSSKDNFIEIGARGELSRCHDKRTTIRADEVESLSDQKWREAVKKLVDGDGQEGKCKCGYECFFQAQEFNPLDYTRFALVGLLYKTGHGNWVRRLGQTAVLTARTLQPHTDWELEYE